MDPTERDASSTSPRRPSRRSRASRPGSSTSASPGSPPGLGAAEIRTVAGRHGIRPARSLGQNFLIDPNLARRIAALVEVGSGDRVLEVGAGLGSLTVALSATGARVLAIERDRRVVPALEEILAAAGPELAARVDVLAADALSLDWSDVLGAGRWVMASNLPYKVATPLLLDMLEGVTGIERYVVMVQREVGERLAAGAGEEHYGAVSLKVAYRARAEVLRRVPPTVFWPRPKVDSVIVRLTPRTPPVDADPSRLFRVVEEGFAERRKTMRNALRRLGLEASVAGDVLGRAGLDPRVRAERVDLEGFARLTRELSREVDLGSPGRGGGHRG